MFDDKEIDAALLECVDRQAAELQLADIDYQNKILAITFQFGVLDVIKELSGPFLDNNDGRKALKMALRHMSEMMADASERVSVNERRTGKN